MSLLPCPSCARHVRSSEAACPFCSAVLSSSSPQRAVPAAGRRLDRLAAFTFAATVAVTGCIGGEEDTDKKEDELGAIQPMYGMPPSQPIDAGVKDSGSKDSGKDADAAKDSGEEDADAAPPCTPEGPNDGGMMMPMYGMPAPPDGKSTPVFEPCPVAEEDGGMMMPMYGMPPSQE